MSNVAIKAHADGPMQYVTQLGCSVPTFTTKSEGKFKHLAYHVPPTMRGVYRPNELATFDVSIEYRVDSLGYVLCESLTANSVKCGKRALNRSGLCEKHGGDLHSDDKFIRTDESNLGETQALSRYQQFLKGIITVDDLDDEELATCGFRAKNGRIYKPKNVPRDLAQGFTKAIYERAQTQLRALTVDAVDTVGEIMKNSANEPDIRLKAALSVIERNLGKPQQVISLTADKPFEEVFTDVFTGTREESRRRRQITSERVEYAEEVPLDGERPNTDQTDNQQFPEQSFGSGSIVDDVLGSNDQTGSVDSGAESKGAVAQDISAFARNEAIMAQTIPVKPFEYDLSDKRAVIAKATKKRAVARALGIDLDGPKGPYLTIQTQNEDGTWNVKHVVPEDISIKQDSKAKIGKRKAYTLSDF